MVLQMTPYPIGIPGMPWPTMVHKEEKIGNQNKPVDKYELGIVEESDPARQMILYSARRYDEVMGMLYRDMPVPSMLPAFEYLIRHADPAQDNRVVNVLSDPGTGKSFLGTLLQKLRDPRRPLVTDAGGKNLESLLFETVFDVAESRPLTNAIDDALANGKLTHYSLDTLRDAFGEYFYEENGKQSVDWDGLSRVAHESDEDVEKKKPGTKRIDRDSIHKALIEVRDEQRWDAQSLGIGFKTKKGLLVEAWEEGRDLLIDELNKCKPGSEAPLQIVWQVLNGETAEHTVKLGSNGTFTFRRGEGGLIVCTGNLPKDGKSTHLISESFDSRVPSYEVPNFDARDWQHRICQQLTGLPISTLYSMQKGKMNSKGQWELDNPEQFTELLLTLRKLGLTEEEKRNIPDSQMSLISNWRGVMNASAKLAEFYMKWSELVDPQSKPLQLASMSDLRAEVDDPMKPTSKITPRAMIDHMKAALQPRPGVKEVTRTGGFDMTFDWSQPVQASVTDRDPPETQVGTRLAEVILEQVYRTSAQAEKPKLYDQLRIVADAAGLTGTEPKIATDLNIDPAKIIGSDAQAIRMQGILANFLRAQYPDLDPPLSKVDNDIIPKATVMAALTKMIKANEKVELSPWATQLFVPNPDINTLLKAPLLNVVADNVDAAEDLDAVRKRLPADKLITDTTLFTALALPFSGGMALKAMWNHALVQKDMDEVVKIAQNQSDSGIAITSVLCQRSGASGSAEYMKLHIVHNSKLGKTLIVGKGNVSPNLRSEMKRNGITYVDREDRNAENVVGTTLSGMIAPEQMNVVREAFYCRNMFRDVVTAKDPTKTEDAVELKTLLTKPEYSGLVVPIFVTSLTPDQIPHAQKSGRSVP